MTDNPTTAAKVAAILASQRSAHGESGELSAKVREIIAAQQSAAAEEGDADLTVNARQILAVQRGQ